MPAGVPPYLITILSYSPPAPQELDEPRLTMAKVGGCIASVT